MAQGCYRKLRFELLDLRIQGNVTQQRTLRLGSEVKFEDGVRAGRIRAIDANGFVVIRGKKRVRRLVFPYSSIMAVNNRVVILRSSPAHSRAKDSGVFDTGGEIVSKKRFIREIDQRLGLSNFDRAERIARITLYLMSKRMSTDQKKQLRKSLPSGIRSLWAVVEQPGADQYFNMSDFLIPIKKQGRFQTMEEAFIAAREVFSSLKRIMPDDKAIEIPRSLPRTLQEIWESAA